MKMTLFKRIWNQVFVTELLKSLLISLKNRIKRLFYRINYIFIDIFTIAVMEIDKVI